MISYILWMKKCLKTFFYYKVKGDGVCNKGLLFHELYFEYAMLAIITLNYESLVYIHESIFSLLLVHIHVFIFIKLSYI